MVSYSYFFRSTRGSDPTRIFFIFWAVGGIWFGTSGTSYECFFLGQPEVVHPTSILFHFLAVGAGEVAVETIHGNPNRVHNDNITDYSICLGHGQHRRIEN